MELQFVGFFEARFGFPETTKNTTQKLLRVKSVQTWDIILLPSGNKFCTIANLLWYKPELRCLGILSEFFSTKSSIE